MPNLKKALAALTSDDVTQVLVEEWPEDEQLEFKRELPTSGDGPDRWVTHGDRVGEPAQRGVFKEVVAFANSYGGDLIIGITESEDNPKRAVSPSPVPDAKTSLSALRWRHAISSNHRYPASKFEASRSMTRVTAMLSCAFRVRVWPRTVSR